MNAIQRHIEDSRKSCIDFVNATFDILLEKVNASNDFLAEMNSTNATHDPGVDYEVAYVATPPEIPTDAEIEAATTPTEQKPLVEQVVKVLEMEKTGETQGDREYHQPEHWQLITPDSENYGKVCAWLINNEKSRTDLKNFQIGKAIRFDKKELDHLFNIIWYREELLKGKDGAFSLRDILNQSDTTDAEKPLWEALAAKHKLK